MKQRTLTPAENAYVATLARRILHIQQQADALISLPLFSTVEATGLSVLETYRRLMKAADITDQELTEALTP